MDLNIHRIKKIVKSKIRDNTVPTSKKGGKARKSYAMDIVFTYDDLGDCRESYSDNTLFGYSEVECKVTLFAETKEALKLKVSRKKYV